jgi:hypothetical protein
MFLNEALDKGNDKEGIHFPTVNDLFKRTLTLFNT